MVRAVFEALWHTTLQSVTVPFNGIELSVMGIVGPVAMFIDLFRRK